MSQLRKVQRQMAKERENRGIPMRMPVVGDGRFGMVRFVYGSPDLVNSPKVLMPLIVTSVTPEGQVSGIAFVDPNMKATDAMGKPQALPPAIPVAGIKYDPKGAKLTWHWPTDKARTENATATVPTKEPAKPVSDLIPPTDFRK